VECAPSCRRSPGRLFGRGSRAAVLAHRRALGRSRGASGRLADHRGPVEECLRPGFAAQPRVCSRHMASWSAPMRRRAACILVKSVDGVAAARLDDRRPCVLAGAMAGWSSTVCRDIQSRWVWLGERGAAKPNERRQLTWLTGCPKPAGLGSPARRRAVRPRLPRHAAVTSRWAFEIPRS